MATGSGDLALAPGMSARSVALPLVIGLGVGLAVPLVVWLGVGLAALTMVGAGLLAFALLRGGDTDFFSPPILFTLLWTLCAVVGAQIVSIHQSPWNMTVWVCVVGAVLAFWVGDLLGRVLTGSFGENLPRMPRRVAPWPVRPVVIGGAVWWLAAVAITLYEFRTLTGGVPLFSENWEKARMIGGEGYVGRILHEGAYSLMVLAMVLQVAILTQPRLFSRATWPVWGLWLASIGVFVLWGSRHNLFFPLAAGVVSVHCLRWRLGLGRLILVGLVGIAFLAAVGYVRTAMIWAVDDVQWSEVLSDIGYDGWPPLLAQAHQTIATNFEIFRRLTETFPAAETYHLGGFSFHWLWSLMPGNQPTLAEWQNVHWNTGFYGTLTSTHMGPVYADFGVVGVLLWTALFAALMRGLWDSLRRRPSGVKVVWFSFMTVWLLMMPYDNLLVKLSFPVRVLILWLGLTIMGARRAESESQGGRELTTSRASA